MSVSQSKAVLTTNVPKKDEMASKRMFDRLVSIGNLKAAIRLVTDQDSGQSLPLNSTQPDGRSVRKHLLDKHLVGAPASASAISDTPPATKPHPIIFDRIDGPLIRSLPKRWKVPQVPPALTPLHGNGSAPLSKVPQLTCVTR